MEKKTLHAHTKYRGCLQLTSVPTIYCDKYIIFI